MRFNYLKCFKYTFSIILLSNIKGYAHDMEQSHKICLRALDYHGCINHNKSTIDNRSSPTIDLRQYGGLSILWSSWQSKKNNHIAQAYNSSNKPIYIALNCNKQMINTTGHNNSWKGWLEPEEKFEIQLIKDFCKNH